MRAALFLALTALAAASAGRKKLPSIVRKCPSAQPEELNKCALERAREVFPKLIPGSQELKVPPLDPFKVERLSVSSNGIDIEFIDMEILNLRNLNFTDIKLDLKNGRLDLKGYSPWGAMKSKYKSTGRMLGLAFNGSGDCTIKFFDMKSHYLMKFKREKNPRDGIDDVVIHDSDFSFEPSRAEYWFENLLFGDEALSKAANVVLNENWRDVFEETKEGVFQTQKQLVTSELRQFFRDVPYNDIFPA